MRGDKPSILFVGPMLGRSPGWVPNPMEILAPKLTEIGYRCILTSRIVPRFRRWEDILSTIVRGRDDYDVLCLQVYSGPSFVVEDSVTVVEWGEGLARTLCSELREFGCDDVIVRFDDWMRVPEITDSEKS